MAPLVESEFCWVHEPQNAEAAAEARRVGGVRRRREGTVQLAYAFNGLATIEDMRRLLEIVAIDTLSMDNGVPRNRTLIAVVMAGLKALEIGDLAERLEALEAIVKAQGRQPSGFDADDELGAAE